MDKGSLRNPRFEPESVVQHRIVRRRKSLVDSVLIAVSMTRAVVIGVQDRRDR
jgi:hypothetical protein